MYGHSSTSAILNSRNMIGAVLRCLTRFPRPSQACSRPRVCFQCIMIFSQKPSNEHNGNLTKPAQNAFIYSRLPPCPVTKIAEKHKTNINY